MKQLPRERTQEIERITLSEYACLSENTRGRAIAEPECDIRTVFQRDRDRIIHCKAFRRLKHKTQVFLSPEGDHYRTRLTHTLEVAQIGRTIARSLRLNEDLTEAIALGHDLGHTPFGHAGERALNELHPDGFKHYLQSVRVCEKLEKHGKGLNLSAEVLDGIACHTGGTEAFTLEGRIIRLADKIAYINHDLEDAVTAGVISDADIPDDLRQTFGNTKSERINTMVMSVINNSTDTILMDEPTWRQFNRIHEFLYKEVYYNPVAKSEESKVGGIIGGLYSYYKSNPESMPDEYKIISEKEGIPRAICDYIAGMTDTFAIQTYTNIYIPKSWNI